MHTIAMTILLFVLISVFLSWNYAHRTYQRRLQLCGELARHFDQSNTNLQRQLDEIQKNRQLMIDNPIKSQLERENRELLNRHRENLDTVKMIRSRIEQNYSLTPVGQFVLSQIEKITPSPASIEQETVKNAQDTFRRIRARMQA